MKAQLERVTQLQAAAKPSVNAYREKMKKRRRRLFGNEQPGFLFEDYVKCIQCNEKRPPDWFYDSYETDNPKLLEVCCDCRPADPTQAQSELEQSPPPQSAQISQRSAPATASAPSTSVIKKPPKRPRGGSLKVVDNQKIAEEQEQERATKKARITAAGAKKDMKADAHQQLDDLAKRVWTPRTGAGKRKGLP
jgi:hypothetical protein